MARLALGPLILTGLFLAGPLCTVSARAETIDLASQPGFHTIYKDWIEDGSTLRLKTDFVSGRTDQVIIHYWQDWEGQFRIHVTPTGTESGIPETDFLAHLHEGAQVNCSLTNPGGKVDMGSMSTSSPAGNCPSLLWKKLFMPLQILTSLSMSLRIPNLP